MGQGLKWLLYFSAIAKGRTEWPNASIQLITEGSLAKLGVTRPKIIARSKAARFKQAYVIIRSNPPAAVDGKHFPGRG